MIYGYARVSTVKQAEKGTSLEAQEYELKKQGAEIVYKDTYTGTKVDRPEFSKLLSTIKSGDTLMVTKLDRFSRTATEGAEIIQELLNKNITVKILNMGTLDNSPMGKLSTMMFLAFAEFERDMIYERTQAGKERKRATGELQEGRPQRDIPLLAEYKEAVQSGSLSVSKACKTLGISRQTWYRRINEAV